MPRDVHGNWYPDLSKKQLQVFNSVARSLLVCGPRLSGKTWAVLHRIIRHMWETPDARVAMFSRTMKNSTDGGPWLKLHRVTMKEWLKANIGLVYTSTKPSGEPGPKILGNTRTPYFTIRNAYGGESECMLFSLDYDDDVEDKLKEMEFSLIYFSELDKFRDRKILSVALPSLRMSHLKYEDQQWIADTNPAEDGESSWIYKVWYVERVQSYEQYAALNKDEGNPVLAEPEFRNFQNGLDLIEIKPEENPWLDPRQLEELKTTYAYDVGLYARYVDGKWVYGQGDRSRHFRAFFKPHHVIGSADPNIPEEEWETIIPGTNCYELVSGWDLGDVNHAAALIEKTLINNRLHFAIVDELVSLKEDISNEVFTEGFMELVQALETTCGRQFDLEPSWSDSSSLERYSATGDTYPYKQVEHASAGRIVLKAGPKKTAQSVRNRVALMKQLLAQRRIVVSAHCKFTIRMLKDLKKGNTPLNYVVNDENKHIFDAITYALYKECFEELELYVPANTGKRGNSELIQIR